MVPLPGSGGPRSRGSVVRALLVVLAGAACGSPTEPLPPEPCDAPTPPCLRRVELGASLYLEAYATHSLTAGASDVKRGIVVVHGTNRNADDYFETILVAARVAGASLDSVLVVSPWFKTESDGPASDEARWTSGGWKRGHLSTSATSRISSYAAIDQILRLMGDGERFPSLRRIVVTGHSAGGQVVHRYAATGRAELQMERVEIRYAPANPSTWLYLGPERWDGAGFTVPDDAACTNYDDWHYGLVNRNSYAGSLLVETIRAQLSQREVQVLLGDLDTGSASLDVTCGANLQGEHRYARGLLLLDYMDAAYPGHRHLRQIVPAAGHSSRSMYTSQVGLSVLFAP